MCELCGCDESPFRSVAVVLPAVDEIEPDTVGVDVLNEWEEEE